MRICIDIDGVICELRTEGQGYADLKPISGAMETINELRTEGHYIILATARHMKTSNSNLGIVLARQGLVTLKWLQDHGIECDEIHFGKPWADVYVDDNAMAFRSWGEIAKELKN